MFNAEGVFSLKLETILVDRRLMGLVAQGEVV